MIYSISRLYFYFAPKHFDLDDNSEYNILLKIRSWIDRLGSERRRVPGVQILFSPTVRFL